MNDDFTSIGTITLEQMRHTPMKKLTEFEFRTLKDLQAQANAAMKEAKSLKSRELVFNVQVAKGWIDFAIRLKKEKAAIMSEATGVGRSQEKRKCKGGNHDTNA